MLNLVKVFHNVGREFWKEWSTPQPLQRFGEAKRKSCAARRKNWLTSTTTISPSLHHSYLIKITKGNSYRPDGIALCYIIRRLV